MAEKILLGSETHTSQSLMARAAYGFAWLFAWRMATRIMGLGSTLVLVRLLAPAEFGIVAIALSFIGSIEQFSQIGVEEALVRMPAPDRRHYDTAFTMIALRCGLIAVITMAVAWPVAWFFNDPRLAPIMLTIAGITVIGGFENVGVLDFRRDMRFDQEFYYQAVPRLGGIVATVTSAFLLRDFWALIIGTAVVRVCRVAMSYRVHPMRPRFSLAAWRDMIGFSLWTWSICMARLVKDQPTTFIMGRALGAAKVGMLSVGSEIAQLPSSEIILPMGRSMFSAFALARRSGEDVEAIFRRLVGVTALVTVPASVGLALVAEPVVRLMLGPAWMDAVPLLQLIALGGALAVFGHACHAHFDAFGLLREDFVVILFNGIVRTGLVAGLVPGYGLVGGAAAVAISLALEPIAYQVMKWWVLPYSPRSLMGVAARPILASAGMTAAVLWTGYEHVDPTADLSVATSHLAASVCIGVIVYTALILVLWWLARHPAGAEADTLAAIRGRLFSGRGTSLVRP